MLNCDLPPQIQPTEVEVMQTAAQAGISWLITYPHDFNDPGIPWAMNEIYLNYCEYNPEVEEMIKNKFTPFINHPIEQAYIKLLDSSANLKISYDTLKKRSIYFDDILIPILYCNQKEIPANIPKKLKGYLNRSGYHNSHAFLAYEWAKKNDCIIQDLEELRLLAMDNMYEEMNETETFGDLFAEQVAFLQYGRYEKEISTGTIGKIIDSQSDTGGWATIQGSNIFGETENPHTTVLAVWALVQYYKECPF